MELSTSESGDPIPNNDLQVVGVTPKFEFPKNSVNPNKDLGWMRRLAPVAKSHKGPLVLGIIVGDRKSVV